MLGKKWSFLCHYHSHSRCHDYYCVCTAHCTRGISFKHYNLSYFRWIHIFHCRVHSDFFSCFAYLLLAVDFPLISCGFYCRFRRFWILFSFYVVFITLIYYVLWIPKIMESLSPYLLCPCSFIINLPLCSCIELFYLLECQKIHEKNSHFLEITGKNDIIIIS